MSVEIFAILRALKQCLPGFSFASVREFGDADWRFPKGRSKTRMADIFSDVREAAGWRDKVFKAGASETLCAYPILRHFLEVVTPCSCIQKERASFIAACRVVDLMQAAKSGQCRLAVPALKRAVRVFFQRHLQAYGQELVRPKHHDMLHTTRQAEEDGFWLDCFVHERKHQLIKDASQSITNTRNFEKASLATVLTKTMENLSGISGTGLVQPCARSPELSAAFGAPSEVAQQLRFDYMYVSVGDLLFIGDAACIVEACVLVGSTLALLVNRLGLLERPSDTSSRWARTTEKDLLEMAAGFVHAACWYYRGDGSVIALGTSPLPVQPG